MTKTKSLKVIVTTLTLLSVVTLTGCVATGVNQTSTNSNYLTGGYESVSASYLDKNGELDIKGDDLESLLVGGKALHDSGYWRQSAEAFERAEKQLAWKSDSVDTPAEVAKLLGTALTNDTLASYNGKIFEGVMLDYYQALNYLMQGDESKARVRFNRLNDRQKNAETQLRKYTETLSKSEKNTEGEKKPSENEQKIIAQTENEAGDALGKGTLAIPVGVKSNEIRNPAGDLLGAVFRSTSISRSDKQGGVIDGLVNHASTKGVSADARKFAGKLGTELKSAKQNHIFVIYEDGRGPSVDEFRVDLPVFLISKDVLYSGIALPEFKAGQVVHAKIKAQSGKITDDLVKVSDLNRMASLEFGASYEGKVAKAVTSAVIKTVAQAAINKEIDEKNQGNPLAGLLMKTAVAAGQAALTQADTRSWFNLPDSIHLGVLKRDSSSALRLSNQVGEELALVTLPNVEGDVLVYARQAAPGGELKVYVQNLPASAQAASL